MFLVFSPFLEISCGFFSEALNILMSIKMDWGSQTAVCFLCFSWTLLHAIINHVQYNHKFKIPLQVTKMLQSSQIERYWIMSKVLRKDKISNLQARFSLPHNSYHFCRRNYSSGGVSYSQVCCWLFHYGRGLLYKPAGVTILLEFFPYQNFHSVTLPLKQE